MENTQPKKKLKAWQIILIVIASIIALFMLGITLVVISALIPHKSTPSQPVTQRVTTIYEKEYDFKDYKKEPVQGKVQTTPITLSEQAEKTFETYLASVKPEYEYASFYQIEKGLKTYSKNQVTKHQHDVRVNGKFDADYLYKLVLKNNDEYFSSGKVSAKMYEFPSKKEIKQLCKLICEVIPAYKKAYPEIDLDTVSCNLYDLKIALPLSSLDNAHIDKNNIFNFDKEQMDINAIVMNTDDIYKTTFYHEAVHLCQIGCDCYNTQPEWKVGFCDDWEESEIDPLCWYFLIEGSAEKIMSSFLKVEYSTYRAYIGYLSSLDYIAQLDTAVDANRVERLNFSHDIQSIFDMFDMRDAAQKEEFIKMMYSIEVLQMRPKGFTQAYQEKTGKEIKKGEDDAFCISLKDDALLSMSKLFYRNLARRVQKGDVGLEDMMYLVKVWDKKLTYHCSVETYLYMVNFKPFFEEYLALQNRFFKMIAAENGMDAKALETQYEQYEIFIKNKNEKVVPNCTLQAFEQNKKQFINGFIEDYTTKTYPSIRECLKLANASEKEIAAQKKP